MPVFACSTSIFDSASITEAPPSASSRASKALRSAGPRQTENVESVAAVQWSSHCSEGARSVSCRKKEESGPKNQRKYAAEATHQAPGAVQRLRILPGAQHLQPAKRSVHRAYLKSISCAGKTDRDAPETHHHSVTHRADGLLERLKHRQKAPIYQSFRCLCAHFGRCFVRFCDV